MKKILIIFLMLSMWQLSLCQEDPDGDLGEELSELFHEEEENELYAASFEEIAEILQKQHNINSLTKETLEKLPFLTSFQIFSFLEYRNKYGQIYSSNELYLLTGFHEELVRKFTILFEFGPPGEEKTKSPNFRSPLRQTLLFRVKYEKPLRRGFTEETDSTKLFSGSPFYRLLKYQAESKDRLRFGFTMENDPGEAFRIDSLNRGFSFNSAFIEYRGEKYLKQCIAGDFRLSSADGLIYSTGRNGKSFVRSFNRNLPELRKYSSTAEYGFNRGVAARLDAGNIRFIG